MTEEIKNSRTRGGFVSDILWMGLAQMLTSLLGLIILPVLTKTYTTDIYGIWAQITVTVTLITPIVNLQLSTAVIRFLAGEPDKEKRRIATGAMILAIIFAAAIILICGNLFAPQVSTFLFEDPSHTTFVSLLLLWIVGDAFFVFFIGNLRARGMIRGIAGIQTSFSMLKVGAIIILALLGSGLQMIVTSNVCIEYAFALCIFGYLVKKDGFPIPNLNDIKEYLAFSLPQIPVGILTWVMGASDRYFITQFLNLSQTGIYSSSNVLASLIPLFYTPIGFVLYPIVSKTWEENKKIETKHYFEYSTRIFLIMAIPAATGIALLSQPLLKILTTSEYLAGNGLVMLMSVSQIFQGLFSLNIYIIYLIKKTKWLPVLTFISAGVSASLNFLLIPSWGITGAAVSKVIAYFILAVIVTIWAKKVINYDMTFRSVAKIIAAAATMGLVLYFIKIDGVLDIILAIIVGAVVYFAMLFLLRAISYEEKKQIKMILTKVIPWRKNKFKSRN